MAENSNDDANQLRWQRPTTRETTVLPDNITDVSCAMLTTSLDDVTTGSGEDWLFIGFISLSMIYLNSVHSSYFKLK